MEILRRWRASWYFPTTLLCIYGFFSSVKPLEPFLIPYLTGPDKNFTIEQVTNQIFPVWTYSYLVVLFPVFMLTDWLRYKPVILVQGLALFLTMATLLWLDTVGAMQAVQFCYSVVTSCEVAYFSYIYSVVDMQFYLKATSFCRAAQLIGYTAGSVLGQVLVSLELMSYYYIVVFTMVLIAIAFVAAVFLPMPSSSMFFHQKKRDEKQGDINHEPECSDKTNTGTPETGNDKSPADGDQARVESAEGKQQDSQDTEVETYEEISGTDAVKIGEMNVESESADCVQINPSYQKHAEVKHLYIVL